MSRSQRLIVVSLLALIVCSMRAGDRALAQTPAYSPGQAQIPTIPDPVAVSLHPSMTAFLALDFVGSICSLNRAASCIDTLPAVASGIAAARAANVLVVYSGARDQILDSVAPQPDDPSVVSSADKFFNTDLDDILKQHGISTVVIVGTFSNGAVLYTSFAASARG